MAKVDLPEGGMNYPSNSMSSPPAPAERPKAQQVVQGKVIAKKPSLGRKFKDVFLTDEVDDVKGYILLDVIIPSIKDLICDAITGTLDMIFYGGRRGRSSRKSQGGGYTSYGSYYAGNKASYSKPQARDNGPGYSVNELIVETRDQARDLLGEMVDIIKDYGTVSVSNLYELAGRQDLIRFTDESWGWDDLRTATYRKVRDGYLLILPKVISLK